MSPVSLNPPGVFTLLAPELRNQIYDNCLPREDGPPAVRHATISNIKPYINTASPTTVRASGANLALASKTIRNEFPADVKHAIDHHAVHELPVSPTGF